MPFEIVPFADTLLDDAAKLLAARHRTWRAQVPLLPARFEEPAIARGSVEAAWQTLGARGVAALDGSILLGYLIGTPRINLQLGRTAWFELPGHALASGQSAEIYRDMYAALAPVWLEQGCFAHYAMIPACDDEALRAWFTLSFGQEHAHGLRDITEDNLPVTVDAKSDLTIRQAVPDDEDALRGVADLIFRHYAEAPVYAPFFPESVAELQDGYAGLIAEADTTVWLALREDRLVGFQAYVPMEQTLDALLIPEHCCELLVAATLPEERGRGATRALMRRAMAWSRKDGYTSYITDWRVTNLTASRVWPRLGFQTAAYRLTRRIDERMAWARG
jgi:GNAT superfamily N-acetyltransferase